MKPAPIIGAAPCQVDRQKIVFPGSQKWDPGFLLGDLQKPAVNGRWQAAQPMLTSLVVIVMDELSGS